MSNRKVPFSPQPLTTPFPISVIMLMHEIIMLTKKSNITYFLHSQIAGSPSSATWMLSVPGEVSLYSLLNTRERLLQQTLSIHRFLKEIYR